MRSIFIRAGVVLGLAISATSLALPSDVLAGSNTWYATPADQGDCGDECYTAPTAWIDESGGKHAFGISCDSTLILGGPAMEVSEVPYSQTTIFVDQRSLGLFTVESGLNDVYVMPAKSNGITMKDVQEAAASGQTLKLEIDGRAPVNFTLKGSRAAINATIAACSRE